MENAKWKEDCACQEEAPQAFTEAGEDMVQPCCKTCESDDPAHGVLLLTNLNVGNDGRGLENHSIERCADVFGVKLLHKEGHVVG